MIIKILDENASGVLKRVAPSVTYDEPGPAASVGNKYTVVL
jgi:hypothetical protein